jgi:hypothetical protein
MLCCPNDSTHHFFSTSDGAVAWSLDLSRGMQWIRFMVVLVVSPLLWMRLIPLLDAIRMENDFCDRSFRPGEIVMNEITVESEERTIEVSRGNKLLASSDTYYPNELLKLSLSEATGDIIFQVDNGTIVSGGCQGIRTCKNQQSLKMPGGGGAVVRIWAG